MDNFKLTMASRLADLASSPPSREAVGIFAFIYSFYHVTNLLIQYYYYYWAGERGLRAWKVQPSKAELVGSAASTTPWLPFLLTAKPGRPAWHAVLMSFNSTLAALAGGLTAECFMRGWLPMHGGAPALLAQVWTSSTPSSSVALLGCSFLLEVMLASVWQNTVEYYWHRLMHTPFFYRHMHKLHHTYKAPTPFDDMMIHPLEAAGYYCILYSPAWLFSLSLPSFLGYMALMGITGVTDHSGVRFTDPLTGGLLYNSAEHDLHHELFDVNFGFPCMWIDRLHGTYREPRAAPPAGKEA